eukprot:COSAG06_NODE_61891_length_266_cov_0.934132_1_plen_40_part_10
MLPATARLLFSSGMLSVSGGDPQHLVMEVPGGKGQPVTTK